MEEAAHEMGREVYFAKFLTSPKLLQLQLRDAYFRRHVLVQLLIFVQTISTDQLQRKGAPALAPRQREAAEKLRARASELLAGIAPNGPLFAAALERLLVRERCLAEIRPRSGRGAAEIQPRCKPSLRHQLLSAPLHVAGQCAGAPLARNLTIQ
mmetsp:Transcript_14181/g.41591  ORF Transcript_14181/g.41591 Transcript_14181/m.41591 type:complete len:154 (+) Transcript_14181:156-617(+)